MIVGSLKKSFWASKSSKKWLAYLFTFANLFLKFSQKLRDPSFMLVFFLKPTIVLVIVEQRYDFYSYVILKKTYRVNLFL